MGYGAQHRPLERDRHDSLIFESVEDLDENTYQPPIPHAVVLQIIPEGFLDLARYARRDLVEGTGEERAHPVSERHADQIRPVALLPEERRDARCRVRDLCLPAAGQQLDLRPHAAGRNPETRDAHRAGNPGPQRRDVQ
jgi:hypothetical protein